MGTKVIYHGNCMDGFTAAWVCWRWFGSDDVEYIAARYPADGRDTDLPDLAGHDIYMVDFSTSLKQLLDIKARAKSLIVLDHHRSAEETCRGLDFCYFDMNQSGAGLAWRHFRGMTDPPWIVSYVEDRDLWRWALPGSRAINAYLGAIKKDFEGWNRVQIGGREVAESRGEAILLQMDSYIRSVGKNHRRMRFAGYDDIPVVNTPHMISALVGHLARDATFAVGWFQDSNGMYVYSLRSRGNLDVSEVAKRFGGGGHAGAAGFTASKPVHE